MALIVSSFVLPFKLETVLTFGVATCAAAYLVESFIFVFVNELTTNGSHKRTPDRGLAKSQSCKKRVPGGYRKFFGREAGMSAQGYKKAWGVAFEKAVRRKPLARRTRDLCKLNGVSEGCRSSRE